MIRYHDQFISCYPSLGHKLRAVIFSPTFIPALLLFGVLFFILFYFLIFYSFWFDWRCSSELTVEPQSVLFCNAETVVTDVALVMGFILLLFCVADCCAERRILGVFLIFLKKKSHSSYFINHINLWHRARKWFNSVFFSLVFIYWSFVCFFFRFVFFCSLFVFMCVAFLLRANRTQGRGVVSHWHFTILPSCTESKILYPVITLT